MRRSRGRRRWSRREAIDGGQVASATLSRVGDELGEYRLLEEIGRGGMGRVYRALQTKLDRVVALKVLPSHRMDDRRAIARFEREMKAIGRLDHPHIVHAYDAREIDGRTGAGNGIRRGPGRGARAAQPGPRGNGRRVRAGCAKPLWDCSTRMRTAWCIET